MKTSEVVVVGGGVIGASVAFFLAREGVEVTVLERESLASGASGAAAGMLAPTSEMGTSEPFALWARRSFEHFEGLAAELLERSGVDCEWVRCGTLSLAFDDAEARALEAHARAGDGRARLEWLDPAALRAAEPGVAEDAFGAVFSPDEAHVRSPRLARAYAAAARRLGARIETGVEVASVRVEGDRVVGVDSADGGWSTPRVVLCTGAWSGTAGAWPRELPPPPIEPVRGQILSLESPVRGEPPAIGLSAMIRGAGGYLVPKRDGSIVVGATEERVGFDARVTAAGVQDLLARARRLAPGLADATFQAAWAGLRPGSPDGLPWIGPVPGIEGLGIATGHHRNGVLFSPVTGRLIADWIAGKGIPDDAAPFLPARFYGASGSQPDPR